MQGGEIRMNVTSMVTGLFNMSMLQTYFLQGGAKNLLCHPPSIYLPRADCAAAISLTAVILLARYYLAAFAFSHSS